MAPVLYFVCAKEMTPISWPAFGAPLLIRIALSALGARQLRLRMLRSGIVHRGCGRPVRTLRTFFVTIGRLLWHLFCTFCVRRK